MLQVHYEHNFSILHIMIMCYRTVHHDILRMRNRLWVFLVSYIYFVGGDVEQNGWILGWVELVQKMLESEQDSGICVYNRNSAC